MCPSGIVIGAVVAETAGLLSIFLQVTITNNRGQNVSLVIHWVFNGDVKADRKGARLLARLNRQSALIFLEDFLSGGRQNKEKSGLKGKNVNADGVIIL